MDFVTGEVLGIDKPLGWTSFDAVKRIRGAVQRRLGVRKFKVGHAGTLDPLATGVLIVCTGRATRRIDELQAGRKEYEAVMRLGATTPSFDLEKEIDATYPYEHVSRDLILETLPQFTGRIMQVPPVFSAVKIDGRRAYEHARNGEEVALAAKPLEIDEFELLDFDGRDMRLRIVCSKGTYIRAWRATSDMPSAAERISPTASHGRGQCARGRLHECAASRGYDSRRASSASPRMARNSSSPLQMRKRILDQ